MDNGVAFVPDPRQIDEKRYHVMFDVKIQEVYEYLKLHQVSLL